MLIICNQCHHQNAGHHNFCCHCGTKLQAPSSDQRPSPAGFTGPIQLQRELKTSSILFVDIINSVKLINGFTPEQSTAYLAPTLAQLKACAHRYGGTINRVDGDGMMVVFGAPTACEQHAASACYAALDMLRAIRLKSKETDIKVRIGIHSGQVLMDLLENDWSLDYEALGFNVSIARRMERQATPNTAIVSKDTFWAARHAVTAIDLGPIEVKGVNEPMNVFQLQARISPYRESITEETPFIGRERPLKKLKIKRLSSLSNGCTHAICSEPGVGKSRLLQEFLGQIKIDHHQSIITGCSPYHSGTNLALFATLLRAWLSVNESDDQKTIAQKLRDRVTLLSPQVSVYLPALHYILDLPIENKQWNSLEPAQKQNQSLEAILALFAALAKVKPLVLLIEDLHWVDPASEALINRLIGWIDNHRIFLVLSFRPEFTRLNQVETEFLDTLSEVESGRFLEYLFDKNQLPFSLRDAIIHRCGGNPLFIEEMIHHLADLKLIQGEKGNYKTELEALPGSLPLTIKAVISARIGRRSATARHCLRIAAVVGQRFSKQLITNVYPGQEALVAEALDELLNANLILDSEQNSADEFVFRHATVHNVALNEIAQDQRQEINSQLVQGIESLYCDRIDEFIFQLAEHAYLGQEWEKASAYCLRACSHAISRSSHRQAVIFLDHGLEALRHLPVSNASMGQRIDFLAVGMNALIPLGEQERLVKDLQEARKICLTLNEPKRTCAILCQLTNALWMVGRHDDALAMAEDALVSAKETHLKPLLVAAKYNMGMALHARGDFKQCAQIQEELVKTLSGDLEVKRLGWTGYPSVFARTFLGNSLLELGQLEAAHEVITRGVELADGANHPYSQAMIKDTYGYYLLLTGNASAASVVLQDGLYACLNYSIPTMVPAISAKLIESLIELNDLTQAQQLADQALANDNYKRGGRYTWFYLFKAISKLAIAEQDLDKALDYALKTLRLTQETGETAHLGWACLNLGQVKLARQNLDTEYMANLINRASHIAQQKNMQLLQFHIRLLANEYHRLLGDEQLAIRYLSQARTQLGLLNQPHFHALVKLRERIA